MTSSKLSDLLASLIAHTECSSPKNIKVRGHSCTDDDPPSQGGLREEGGSEGVEERGHDGVRLPRPLRLLHRLVEVLLQMAYNRGALSLNIFRKAFYNSFYFLFVFDALIISADKTSSISLAKSAVSAVAVASTEAPARLWDFAFRWKKHSLASTGFL